MTKIFEKNGNILHQHVNEKGEVLGKEHPIKGKHKKESTIKFHNLSVEHTKDFQGIF